MKAMLIFMQETCTKLIQNLEQFADKNEEFEIKECLGKYSMDTIASCAFGVDSQSFTNENSPFVKYAKTLFTSNFKDAFKLLMMFMPMGFKIMNFFKIPITKATETEFFYDVVMASLKSR